MLAGSERHRYIHRHRRRRRHTDLTNNNVDMDIDTDINTPRHSDREIGSHGQKGRERLAQRGRFRDIDISTFTSTDTHTRL